MGSLSSVITPVLNAGTALSSVARFATPLLKSGNKERSLVVSNAQAQQDAAFRKQQNLLTYNNAETDRLQRLRRALSTQQAKAGGQGIGNDGGSNNAVLQGINEVSDISRQENQSAFNQSNNSIDQSLSQQRQINLLQRQQLQHSKALSFLTDNF
ncbi:MAG: hypothetical protein AAB276_05270 [Pseudomonadota bacterium]